MRIHNLQKSIALFVGIFCAGTSFAGCMVHPDGSGGRLCGHRGSEEVRELIQELGGLKRGDMGKLLAADGATHQKFDKFVPDVNGSYKMQSCSLTSGASVWLEGVNKQVALVRVLKNDKNTNPHFQPSCEHTDFVLMSNTDFLRHKRAYMAEAAGGAENVSRLGQATEIYQEFYPK